MRSQLFHAIVLVGSSLGAGCRTQPLSPDVGDGSTGGEAADQSVPRDQSISRDQAVPRDLAPPAPPMDQTMPTDACPCPFVCGPGGPMRSCNGLCADGCICYPCYF